MKTTLIVIGVLLLLSAGWWLIGFIYHRARMQHYIFAHQLLPAQLFFDSEAALLPLLSPTGFSSEGREHLLQYWAEAGKDLGDRDLVAPDELTYSMEVLGHPNFTAFFVVLPKPCMTTEAYFVLMVFDAPGLCCGKMRHLRYFALEHHGLKDGKPNTVIGEWRPKEDGTLKYVSHDKGPLPEKTAFMDRVQAIVEASEPRPPSLGQDQAS